MLFRFMETVRGFSNFSEVPVSKNGNRFLSFRAKQLRADGGMAAETTLTVWGDELCKYVLGLKFGDIIRIDGLIKDFSAILSLSIEVEEV